MGKNVGGAVYCSMLQCGVVCCSVLQCVAVCCSVLQVCCKCVAMCCSVFAVCVEETKGEDVGSDGIAYTSAPSPSSLPPSSSPEDDPGKARDPSLLHLPLPSCPTAGTMPFSRCAISSALPEKRGLRYDRARARVCMGTCRRVARVYACVREVRV